jgi:hypothetical protein
MREATGGETGIVVEDGAISALEELLGLWRLWSRVGQPGPKRVRAMCLVGASSRAEIGAADEALCSALDVAVAGLPDAHGLIIRARYLWCVSDVTLAQKMRCCRDTVIQRRKRALEALQKKMNERKAA